MLFFYGNYRKKFMMTLVYNYISSLAILKLFYTSPIHVCVGVGKVFIPLKHLSPIKLHENCVGDPTFTKDKSSL